MRFRMCCWPLSANRNQHLPRSERRCYCCNHGVEDERHVLLECEAYADIRESYGLPRGNMQQIMNDSDQNMLACCLSDIWARRNKLLRLRDSALRVHEAHNNANRRDEEPLRLG